MKYYLSINSNGKAGKARKVASLAVGQIVYSDIDGRTRVYDGTTWIMIK
jgi:hypothetical protein